MAVLFPSFRATKKKQKARHARKNSRKHSLLISAGSIRSNARLPLDTSSGSRGAAELAPHGYLKKYIPALRSNILAQWPLTRSVSHSIFNGAGFRRWRRITLAMGNHSRSNLLKNGTVWAWVVVSGKRGKRTEKACANESRKQIYLHYAECSRGCTKWMFERWESSVAR